MRNPILNATLNLTQNCNLSCAYCFTHGKTKKVMPLDIGKKSVDFLLENARGADSLSLGTKKREIDICFWGGEPLLEWGMLKKLVSYCGKNEGGIPISFSGTTNGTLLTEEKLGFLKDHRINFLVSFDGTEISHNTFRKFRDGSGSHSVILKNIESALKRFGGLQVRMSPFAEGIHRFYEDVRFIAGLGIKHIMFSPVYESNWTEERFKRFESECVLVTDFLIREKNKGNPIEIEHYKSYTRKDNSRWPCGAGRFYAGIDIDGAIYPCHRFNKFSDGRKWFEKEVCIGHIDHGITNPAFREMFIQFKPIGCDSCEYDKLTPCHGGCYAINYDLTGNIRTPPQSLCRYTKMQSKISTDYREQFGPNGIPTANIIPANPPRPEDFLNVIIQMNEKLNLMERTKEDG